MLNENLKIRVYFHIHSLIMATASKPIGPEHLAVRFFQKSKEDMICQVVINIGAVAEVDAATEIAAASLCGNVIKIAKDGTKSKNIRTKVGNLAKIVEKELFEMDKTKAKSQERK